MLRWTPVVIGPGLAVSVARNERGICRTSLAATAEEFHRANPGGLRDDADALLLEAAAQLRAYFGRKLHEFKLPVDLAGTAFQRRVWDALLTIGYGQVQTYAAVAAEIGAPKAVRAVGAANGRNPAPILVPCHRVIQTGGGLGGYTGGLHFKRMLLAVEGRQDLLEGLHGEA